MLIDDAVPAVTEYTPSGSEISLVELLVPFSEKIAFSLPLAVTTKIPRVEVVPKLATPLFAIVTTSWLRAEFSEKLLAELDDES